ncbi:3-hydroxyacyl-CoA dehydrogenase NAD-binding domain-containing protein [Sphingobium sp. EP60837]|uniref:3-hydroxyacyl-CoA dehydrogenase NAD-binding domain-containing protein n=1 Tax=Sphingobium sp. EP60837 TaxID=1855519 RepID=UPI0007DE2FD2|nr:3-hydroxyacyl-CoA dehydrogenase NAD-binding domain-containing protein [Sphingobium sp. EP60837]ANI79246.1 3-hydroxyacyl-CoA dehydrogenase [Sphingobium sp. EP60837]
MKVEIVPHGATVLLRLSNGPVNALSVGKGFVEAIGAMLRLAANDPNCRAIIIAGAGTMFCGGADISDFDGDPLQIEEMREMMNLIEGSDKPIIMAIHGMALGGGLELALAGHYRLAQSGALLGLPEVTLGLLPGAGGTQRLPRLIGAGPALDMMLSGVPLTAEQALERGLIDRLVEGDVVGAALEFARTAQLSVRRTGDLAVPCDLAEAVGSRRAKLPPTLSQAPAFIIDSVAAVSDDLAYGLDREAALFGELMLSPASRSLRHAFLGERSVSRLPGLSADMQPRTISEVGVVGGGLMGTGIAISLLNAGLSVTMVELRPEALAKAEDTIRKTLMRDVEKGRISAEVADAQIAAFTPATALDALADVDLVIEAVFEDMAVKQKIFTSLDAVTRPDTILASNTSTLDVDAIANLTRAPSRVVGLHFFSPANVMRLLEVVRGRETAPDVLVTGMALGKRMRKVSVVSGVCDGFIGNRMFEEYLRQVWFMLEEGALPQQIDAAMEEWGMAMGPCRAMDLAGQDIGWAIRKRRAIEQPGRSYSGVIDRICELGRFGQKTGQGIYTYPDGRTAKVDPDITRLIEDYSDELGVTRRSFSNEEIIERCLLALINEGARIVGEGIAFRPVDVDMVYLHGYGFSRERGGPMFQGDLIGLPQLLERLRSYSSGRNGWVWTPAPLIEQLASEQRQFSDLNT